MADLARAQTVGGSSAPAYAATPPLAAGYRRLRRHPRLLDRLSHSSTRRSGCSLMGALLPIGIYALLAMGLNIVVGYAGLLDLGYAAFFAIGAYTVGFLTSPASVFVRAGWVPAVFPAVLAGAGRRLHRGRHLRRPARRADAAPAGRLPRDRDPRLRRDRAELLPQRRAAHRRHAGDQSDRQAAVARAVRVSGRPTSATGTG